MLILNTICSWRPLGFRPEFFATFFSRHFFLIYFVVFPGSWVHDEYEEFNGRGLGVIENCSEYFQVCDVDLCVHPTTYVIAAKLRGGI